MLVVDRKASRSLPRHRCCHCCGRFSGFVFVRHDHDHDVVDFRVRPLDCLRDHGKYMTCMCESRSSCRIILPHLKCNTEPTPHTCHMRLTDQQIQSKDLRHFFGSMRFSQHSFPHQTILHVAAPNLFHNSLGMTWLLRQPADSCRWSPSHCSWPSSRDLAPF